MKRTLLLCLILISFALTSEGQSKKLKHKVCPASYSRGQFLDTVFYEGLVTHKDMGVSPAYYNYSLATNNIVYLDQQNNVLSLGDVSSFLQISYGQRTFIPLNKKDIAEIVKVFSNGAILLLKRSSVSKSNTKGAYGSPTTTASTEQVRYFNDYKNVFIPIDGSLSNTYQLNTSFFLKIDNKVKPVGSIKNIIKIFPAKADAINAEAEKKIEKESESEKLIRILSPCCE